MSSKIFTSPLPYLALLIAHIIWGANFVVAKVTLQEIPPNSLAFLRFGLACLLLTPFLLAETKKVKIAKEDLPKLVLIGVLIITLNITFFFAGITKTTVINAAVLTLIIPVLSVFFGWIFLKEKVYLINLAGIVLGFLGAIIILRVPQFFIGTFSPTEVIGNILLILASIAWVAGAVISREMLKKYPSLIVTSIAFMVGTVTFILPAANEYLHDPTWLGHVTWLGIFGLVYMTLLSSISAYFLFEWGLAKTSVVSANLLQYIEPFVAAGLAIMLLGEQITVPLLVGAVLITAGVYLGTLAKESHHKSHKTHRF
ncbi:MAG: EamA family transporter [Candidatus Daviesbacteria bacterium]|nr:EamA family transporter [Candidatus Daviesbacteria bacterium]